MKSVGYFFLLLLIAFCILRLDIVFDIFGVLYGLAIIIAIGVGIYQGNR
jgi:hypothetical protein